MPERPVDEAFWAERYEDINSLERQLVRNGTVIVKFFLHISKDEQMKQLLERLQDPTKHWKFSPSDLAARKVGGLRACLRDDDLQNKHRLGELVDHAGRPQMGHANDSGAGNSERDATA
jgi:hypothetical protein